MKKSIFAVLAVFIAIVLLDCCYIFSDEYPYTRGYSLTIDGEVFGYAKSEDEINSVLEKVKTPYINKNTISAEFAEDVVVSPSGVKKSLLSDLDVLFEQLATPTKMEVTYTVAKGDTWSQIANDHGLSSKDLQKINSEHDMNHIHVGDMLVVEPEERHLNVITVEEQHYTERIAYETLLKIEPDWEDGKMEYDWGKPGVAAVIANVTLYNGIETTRVTTDYDVLKEAENTVIHKGTKKKTVAPAQTAQKQEQTPATETKQDAVGENNTGIIPFGNSINDANNKTIIIGGGTNNRSVYNGGSSNSRIVINGQEVWNGNTDGMPPQVTIDSNGISINNSSQNIEISKNGVVIK